MNYYEQLSDGYYAGYTLDEKSKKAGAVLNILSAVVWIGTIIVSLTIKKLDFSTVNFGFTYVIYLVAFVAILLLYYVLHELTCGLVYKIFTKRKLTISLNISATFCGVPELYVKKWPAFLVYVTPFVLFTAIEMPALFFIDMPEIYVLTSAVLGIHFGKCVSDLYIAGVILFKFSSHPELLVNDTGRAQTFFVKSEQ